MASTSGSNGGDTNGTRSNRQLNLFTKNNFEITESIEILEEFWSNLDDELIHRINTTPGAESRFYISDVITLQNTELTQRLLEKLNTASYKHRGIFFIVSQHGDHIHVVHDCTYSGGSCRCTWRKEVEIKEGLRGRIRRPRQTGTFRKGDFKKIIKYFTTYGRKCHYFTICGTTKRLYLPSEHLENTGLSNRLRVQERMEICGTSFYNELQEEQPYLQIIGTAKRASNEITRQNTSKRSRSNVVSIRIEKMIWNNLCFPPESIVHLDVWLNDDDLAHIREDNPLFRNAVDVVKSKMCKFTIHDFYTLYTNEECNPHFAAGHTNFYDYYYTVTDTKEIIERLLTFQLYNYPNYIDYINGEWVETEQAIIHNSNLPINEQINFVENRNNIVRTFLQQIYFVLEKKLPKKNTILIHGPVCCGKNFFIDMILNFFINKGQLNNANKFNNFPFQDAPNRRIIFWDEPNYEAGAIEQMKNIFGGDSCKVRVKFKEECTVYRTPVFVLTNHHISLITMIEFNPTRMFVYHWKQADFLANYKKKPNPLYTYHLFKDYNILTE